MQIYDNLFRRNVVRSSVSKEATSLTLTPNYSTQSTLYNISKCSDSYEMFYKDYVFEEFSEQEKICLDMTSSFHV